MNGMEIMLKSMGLGNIIEIAQRMATDGTLDKILAFAENLEQHNVLLQRLAGHCPNCGAVLIPGADHRSDGVAVNTVIDGEFTRHDGAN